MPTDAFKNGDNYVHINGFSEHEKYGAKKRLWVMTYIHHPLMRTNSGVVFCVQCDTQGPACTNLRLVCGNACPWANSATPFWTHSASLEGKPPATGFSGVLFKQILSHDVHLNPSNVSRQH